MKSLTAMVRLTRQEIELMVDIAAKPRRDSRTMRTTIIIAMVYLPASVVAVIYIQYSLPISFSKFSNGSSKSFFGILSIDVNKAHGAGGVELIFSNKLWWFAAIYIGSLDGRHCSCIYCERD